MIAMVWDRCGWRRGVSRGGDGALRPGQGMAWLAQESTGCERRGS